MPGKQLKLGDLLVQAGLIDELQLKSALGYQRRWGGKLGKCLVDQGFIEEEVMLRFLSQYFKMRAVDLTRSRIAPQTFAMVPEAVARKYEVVPVVVKDTPGKKTLVLAMSDPSDLQAVDEIQFLTNCKVEPVLATDSAIAKVLSHYGDYSPEMITGPQWGAKPAELRRKEQEKTQPPKAVEPQIVGEGFFDLTEEGAEGEGVGILPDEDIEIIRDEVTMIRAGREAPAAKPAAPPKAQAPAAPPARPVSAPPAPPPKPSAPARRPPEPPRPSPPATRPPAPPPPPPLTPPPRPAAPAKAAPPPKPAPPAEESPFLEPTLEGQPQPAETGSQWQTEIQGEQSLDMEIPPDNGSEMELVGAHEFVPVLEQEQVSKTGVGVEHARTSLDRALFEREAVRADSALARAPADESVTELPGPAPGSKTADDFFLPPKAKPEPAPTPPVKLDLPDLDLPPEPAPPPPPAVAPPRPPSPARPAPPPPAAPAKPASPPKAQAPAVPPTIQPVSTPAVPPLSPPPQPTTAKPAVPPIPPPLPPDLESEILNPPSLGLAEETAEEDFPPPVQEPHAPPVPEFDLPPAPPEYEFSPASALPFEQPPPQPAFEGDLAERPDTPDFSALAEKELPRPELTEEEMFFNVEREPAPEPEIATGEMERIPAAPEASARLAETRRRLAELEELGEDFLDAQTLKSRLQLIEDLKSEVREREFQFDELLNLMMKKEMGELTSELFMKELKLLKRRVDESRRKKSKDS